MLKDNYGWELWEQFSQRVSEELAVGIDMYLHATACHIDDYKALHSSTIMCIYICTHLDICVHIPICMLTTYSYYYSFIFIIIASFCNVFFC